MCTRQHLNSLSPPSDALSEFEDVRVPGAEWPALKASGKFAMPSMPALEIDGKFYAESGAMARHFGAKSGLYPVGTPEGLVCDEILLMIEGMLTVAPTSAGKTPEEFKAAREEYEKTKMTSIFNHIEKRAGEAGDDGFLCGKNATLADYAFHSAVALIGAGFFDHINPKFAAGFPKSAAALERFRASEGYKAYKAKYEQ